MIKQTFLSAFCIASLGLLQACSDSDNDSGPWHSPNVVYDAALVSASKISSNDDGDIVIVWQETESDVRVDQALSDAHDPTIAYNESDPISDSRDMDPNPDVTESYDSSNPTHRAEAKLADYGEHDAHTHVDIYTRTNILSKVFDASSSAWRATSNLQTGYWQLSQKGSYPGDDTDSSDITITDNVSASIDANISVASNSQGNALAAWIQVEESATDAGDAGSVYEIYTARYTASSNSWSSVEQITRATDEQLLHQDLTVTLDNNGNGILLWLARNPTSDVSVKLYSATYDATAGTWNAATLRSDSNAASQSAKITMINDTSGVALWLQRNTSGKSTYVEQANEGDLCLTTPSICNAEQFNLYSQQFDATGWLATPLLVSDALGEVKGFDVSSNGAGSLWGVYEQQDIMVSQTADPSGVNAFIYPLSVSQVKNLMVSQLNISTNSWSAPSIIQKVAEGGNSPEHAQDSQIAMDSNGNVMVVWMEQVEYLPTSENNNKWNNSIRNNIWVNTYNATDASWSQAQLVASDDRFSAKSPQLVARSVNQFSILWAQWNTSHESNSGHQIYSVDYNLSSGQFSTASQIANDNEEIDNIHLMLGAKNQLKVLWQGGKQVFKESER